MNIPEVSVKTYKFKLHDKEVFIIILDNHIDIYKNFFDNLNQFKTFEESKKILISQFKLIMSIDILTDEWVFKNLIGQQDIFSKVEELHIIYMRENKIDNIVK
jgi:predicted unusual protein kinase regulating ubiquinone biosynthesis (AarF/ABC1/UbiB family)